MKGDSRGDDTVETPSLGLRACGSRAYVAADIANHGGFMAQELTDEQEGLGLRSQPDVYLTLVFYHGILRGLYENT